MNDRKILGLELIRFVSALAVLFWHYQHFAYIGGEQVGFRRHEQPLYDCFKLFYEYGHFGVQVFWCISGFIFFWRYSAVISDRLMEWGTFFVLRFSRLYPLHFLTLLMVAALQATYFSINGSYFVWQNNDLPHFMLQIFLASAWGFEQGFSFNGPIWSISVEVLVYAIFFLALRFLTKALTINFLIVGIYLTLLSFGISTSLVLDCAAFFYAGGVAARVFEYASKSRVRRLWFFLCMSILVLTPWVAYDNHIFESHRTVLVFMLFYVPTLLCVAAVERVPAQCSSRWISAAGNMTYSSYLIHFPLQLLLALVFARMGWVIPMYSPFFLFAFLCATLILSHIIYLLLELPAQCTIRRRLLGNQGR